MSGTDRGLWADGLSMERFVKLVVAGGVALVAGLWVAALTSRGTPPWLAGVALAVLGVAALAAGIWRELAV